MFDAAHIAGLIAGGVHPNPVPYADIVTLTTHKTLRGPRGGCILCTAEHAEAIDKAVFPGLQGGPLDHVDRGQGRGVPRGGPARVHGLRRSRSSRNAAALAEALAGHGLRLVSGGTDNHLMLVDLRTFDAELSGKKARLALDRAGISLNENTVPDDPRPPYITSGLRIGTPAVTTQGMGEPRDGDDRRAHPPRARRAASDDAELAAVRDEVAALCSKFTPYPS